MQKHDQYVKEQRDEEVNRDKLHLLSGLTILVAVLRVILPALNSARALVWLLAGVLPNRAPPTAMISFCLRDRGIVLLVRQSGDSAERRKERMSCKRAKTGTAKEV